MRSRDTRVVTADLQREPPIQRAVAASKGMLRRRLLLLAGALLLASSGTVTALSASQSVLQVVVDGSLTLFAGFASLTGAVYFIIRFALTSNQYYAFSSFAFWAIACGVALRILINNHLYPALEHFLAGLAWLVAGMLLTIAGYAHSVTRETSAAKSVLRTAARLSLCFGLPVVIAWALLDGSRLIYLNALSSLPICTLVQVTAASALTLALLSQYRCWVKQAEGVSAVVCYFLVPCILSLMFEALAGIGVSQATTMSSLCALLAWPILAVGFGIQTALEHTQITDKLQELETLHEVSWSVVGAHNLNELLQAFAESLRQKLGASVATVYTAGDVPDSLRVAAACGPDGPLESLGVHYPLVSSNPRPGLHSGHTVKAFTTGAIQVVEDVFVDVELVNWRTIGRENGGAVSIPMTDDEGTLGVLTLYFSDRRQITRTRLKLLSTLAASATPAIRNVQQGSQTLCREDEDSLDVAA